MSGFFGGVENWMQQEADNFIEHWPIPGLDALSARDRHAVWIVIRHYGLQPTFDTINLFARIISDPIGVLREELHRIFDPAIHYMEALALIEQSMAGIIDQSGADAQRTLTAIFNGPQPLHTKPTNYIAATYIPSQQHVSLGLAGRMANATDSQTHWVWAIVDFIGAVIAFAIDYELLMQLSVGIQVVGVGQGEADPVSDAAQIIDIIIVFIVGSIALDASIEQVERASGKVLIDADDLFTPPPNDPRDFLKTILKFLFPAVIVTGIAIGIIVKMLTQSQQQQAIAIATKYNVNLQDVQRLLAAGFTEEQIVAMLQGGYTTTQIIFLVSVGLTSAQLTRYAKAGIPSSALDIVIQRIKEAQGAQSGTDQYGVPASRWPTILDKLAKLLENAKNVTNVDSAKGYQLEATMVINELLILVNAGEDKLRDDKSVLVDVDIETPCAIIEVTTQDSKKVPQIKKLLTDPANPLKKEVILFAPNYGGNATQDITNLGVKVFKTIADLDAYLKNLKCKNPGGGEP